MIQAATIWHLMVADFRERTRRPSFLVTLLVALYMGYLYLPDVAAGYVTVTISHARGIYNSAWVGAVGSIMSSAFLSLIGFYLVKNAIARDRQTGVGQMLSATPLTRFQYLLSKAFSNFAVLATIQGLVVAAVALMQQIRGESTVVNVVDLVAPSLFMVLPFLALVSALAVFFEVVPFLRGAMGNVIFYFLWTFVLIMSFSPSIKNGQEAVVAYNDPAGVTQLMHSISLYARDAVGILDGGVSIGVHIVEDAVSFQKFEWPGMEWTLGLILGRIAWYFAAIGLVGIAVPFFDRFGSAAVHRDLKEEKTPAPTEMAASSPVTTTHLSPLNQVIKSRLMALVQAELVLMWRSVGRWWFLTAAGLSVVMLFVPLAVSRQWLWPLSWIWPIGIWSSLGVREKLYGTEQILYSTYGAFFKRLAGIWFSGVAIAALCAGGIAVRFLIDGDSASVIQWIVGAMFVPSLALACGTWSNGTRLFEGLYVMLWYAGPMNQAAPFDFAGIRPETYSEGITATYAGISVILFAIACFGRLRQMRL